MNPEVATICVMGSTQDSVPVKHLVRVHDDRLRERFLEVPIYGSGDLKLEHSRKKIPTSSPSMLRDSSSRGSGDGRYLGLGPYAVP